MLGFGYPRIIIMEEACSNDHVVGSYEETPISIQLGVRISFQISVHSARKQKKKSTPLFNLTPESNLSSKST